MDTAELLADGFGRVREGVRSVLDGIGPDELGGRPGGANSIAWLVWHVARTEDHQVAGVAGAEQQWASGWADRFDLPFDRRATGYGQSSAEVDALAAVPADLLGDYYEAVHAATLEHLRGWSEADLDRVVDEAWDPPVTLGVRLVSSLADELEHVGQAAYARGLD